MTLDEGRLKDAERLIPIILMGACCLILPEHKSWFTRSPRA
jgi:hypothetical protein